MRVRTARAVRTAFAVGSCLLLLVGGGLVNSHIDPNEASSVLSAASTWYALFLGWLSIMQAVVLASTAGSDQHSPSSTSAAGP